MNSGVENTPVAWSECFVLPLRRRRASTNIVTRGLATRRRYHECQHRRRHRLRVNTSRYDIRFVGTWPYQSLRYGWSLRAFGTRLLEDIRRALVFCRHMLMPRTSGSVGMSAATLTRTFTIIASANSVTIHAIPFIRHLLSVW